MTKLSRDTLYSEGRRHQSLKKLLMVWLTIFNVYIIKSLMWRMMICFHKFEYKLIDIQKMFCCVYFQKADWKHLIWKIRDYSRAILVAQLSNFKKVPLFHMGTPPHKILGTGLLCIWYFVHWDATLRLSVISRQNLLYIHISQWSWYSVHLKY